LSIDIVNILQLNSVEIPHAIITANIAIDTVSAAKSNIPCLPYSMRVAARVARQGIQNTMKTVKEVVSQRVLVPVRKPLPVRNIPITVIGSLGISVIESVYGGILVVPPPKYPHIFPLPRQFPESQVIDYFFS